MSNLVLELESLKDGLLVLFGNAPGAHLRFAPAPSRLHPSRLAITSEQFAAFDRDIEGHAEGKYGVARDLQINVHDESTGERERVSFEEAKQFLAGNVLSDATAAALQAQADETAKRAHDARKRAEAAGGPVVPGAGGFTPVAPLTES